MDQEMNRLSLLSMQVEKESIATALQAKEIYNHLGEFLKDSIMLSSKKRTITIIGGGIIGLMAAYFLQKNGYGVTILERKSFGAAASGRNGGGVLALGRELREIPFARLAIEIWDALELDGIDTKFVRSGNVMVASNETEKQKLLAAHDLYQASGLTVKILSANEMKTIVPDIFPQINMGLLSETDAQSYPFTTIKSIISYLKENGVKVIDHCEVYEFKTNQQEIEYATTNKGNYQSDAYLFCAGPWTTELCNKLNEEIPVLPRRSQILVTEIMKKRKIHPFVAGNSIYLRQTHAGNILFGGGGPWETNGYDVSNTNFAIEFLTKRFIEIFPGYRNKQLIRAFAGTVELTRDHLPYFGKINSWDNAFISAGYNGHGYGMSTVMGKLMAKSLSSYFAGKVNPVETTILSNFSVARIGQKVGDQYV
ncbi:FAD-binding oxidoreductase [Neobacillus sp. PS2-9]|uniref:NAD(P)/FAD-dependent oxidoreductase n=1 Tax=Neobacillus sp. PS2-9 TaxID=3070676 RepID=UPI0027E1DF96|nr:FAD-binding oxidoreductase [Neobacillus sp. PS2-9]WML60377.1 FAD-binding oxidoreductase [Neobacillus sp. PS2-9]